MSLDEEFEKFSMTLALCKYREELKYLDDKIKIHDDIYYGCNKCFKCDKPISHIRYYLKTLEDDELPQVIYRLTCKRCD